MGEISGQAVADFSSSVWKLQEREVARL
jgi:hypothetical protein